MSGVRTLRARGFVLAAAMLALVAGTTACGSGAKPGARPDGPNVLLISIDSLRTDHVGGNGYPRSTTPVLDRLAREGASCPQTSSTTSWTLPAHVSLLTALPASVHQVSFGRGLDPARETLAEALGDHGYQTAGFATGPWMTPAFGMDHGFDEFENTSAFGAGADDPTRPSSDAHLRSHSEVTSATIARQATDWLDRNADEPFFLFLHFWDVHFDYVPPAPFDEMFDPGYRGTVDGRDFARNPEVHPRMAARDLEHVVALYDGEIRHTDRYVGQVVERLGELGILDDTIVIVTADHGDEFFEHGEKGHNKSLYDEVILVPLIVRWPERIPAGSIVNEQVRLIDVFPTVLELTGVDASEESMGRSLAARLSGGAPEESRPAFLDLFLLPEHQYQGLRTDRTKSLARYRGDATLGAVFDLVTDPQERRPMTPAPGSAAGRAFEGLQSTRTALESMRDALPKSADGKLELSAEAEEQLRRLGYIE